MTSSPNPSASFDFLNTLLTNPAICYDVTVGNNGGYKAGPGRDDVSGYGVVDVGRLLAVLTSGTQVPAPGGNPPPPPTPTPGPDAPPSLEYENFRAALELARPHPQSKPKVASLITTGTAFEKAYDTYVGRQ